MNAEEKNHNKNRVNNDTRDDSKYDPDKIPGGSYGGGTDMYNYAH